MKLLFVTATNTNIGKTYTSLKLIDTLANRGISVGVCKPIETGVEGQAPDAFALLTSVQSYNKNFKNLTEKEITAYTFLLPASPFCADRHQIIKIEHIKDKINELSKLCDILIVEGAGGLMVPITQDYMMIDLIQELNAKTLLVASSKLGSINDTLLSMEALKNREIDFDWGVNLFEDRDSFDVVTKPFYDKAFPSWWSIQEGLDGFVDNVLGKIT
ncbi:MAG: dethiobiotin synthase [Sulfurovaceae bacterium]|nr:dethiobiotin synthase [Sulfurovaceae bacterium]